MNLHNKIKELRRSKGKSQEKLAAELGVSRQAVAKWELGKSSPDVSILVDLAKSFGVTIDYLLNENEYKPVSNVRNDTLTNKIEFLLKAKLNTYAGKTGFIEPSRPNAYDLKYEEGELLYIDSYIGSYNFTGQEAIWEDKKPIWSMIYTGRVLDPAFSSEFLKEALSLGTEDLPYRGPRVHIKGAYTYHLIVDGNLDWFNGFEEILYDGKRVYECRISGGKVIDE